MAAYTEITLEQFSNFETSVDVEDLEGNPLVLDGYTANAQMRRSFYSATAYDFGIEFSNTTTGRVILTMTDAETANLTPGRYMYDLTINSANTGTQRVVEGIATVLPGVTR